LARLIGDRRSPGTAAGGHRRRVRGRGAERDRAGKLVSLAQAAGLSLRAAAPSFSTQRLARGQDRGAVLDRRRTVRHGRAGGVETGGSRRRAAATDAHATTNAIVPDWPKIRRIFPNSQWTPRVLLSMRPGPLVCEDATQAEPAAQQVPGAPTSLPGA